MGKKVKAVFKNIYGNYELLKVDITKNHKSGVYLFLDGSKAGGSDGNEVTDEDEAEEKHIWEIVDIYDENDLVLAYNNQLYNIVYDDKLKNITMEFILEYDFDTQKMILCNKCDNVLCKIHDVCDISKINALATIYLYSQTGSGYTKE